VLRRPVETTAQNRTFPQSQLLTTLLDIGTPVSFGFVAHLKSGKAPTVLTHTATHNRSVLCCPGYLLRRTRRCHTPRIIFLTV
jgi:hypothetical protein